MFDVAFFFNNTPNRKNKEMNR